MGKGLGGPEAYMVQWLKLPTWEVGDRGFKLRYGIQVLKKQTVSSLVKL